MKIVVSSKVFRRQAFKAVKNNTKNFIIDGSTNSIAFNGIESGTFHAIVVEYNNRAYRAKFNRNKWKKIMHFLDSIEEQPVTISFTENTRGGVNENPEIEISQFVKRF